MKNSDTEKIKKELEMVNNSNRLEILKYLKHKGGKSVGDIADGTNLPFKTASRQLLYLAEKNVLERHYDTPFVLYSIRSDVPEIVNLIIKKLL